MQFLFDNFFALTISGLALGAVYALIALGYTMVYGVLQFINFAHSEVFMYGTFAVVWVLYFMGASGTTGPAVYGKFAIALLVAMAVSASVALLLERVAYRPLIRRGAPRLIALISAIGASFMLAEAMGLRDRLVGFVGLDDELAPYVARARDTRGLPLEIPRVGLFTIGDYRVTNIDVIVILSALLMMVLLDQFVRRSRLGRGIRAVAQDPESAALMGVNSTRVVQLTFLLGGIMAGAAATLYMVRIGATRFDAGFLMGVKAFTAAVMGGIGNLRGALLGGFVLGVAENWGSAVIGTEWKDVVAFALLVLILLFRPTGLLGESLGKARA
ncbi:branched-chain amino acid ABC transporter permease [Ornithinimicrobium tianjinense]|uniref:Branched-chain amino acid ABC transporter permease n=1 Tax=Ornithinimicrobium tianjinense TaxID=1195761 RepID=A0A917F2D3_9MICO|nr:branched-chain amino acid ABC transporter permease [Ornithinimicrobium tianjinense]GGF41602.1 branched-chain amino acid ABC transporter permease [Ornithinimicrobium tianjinense]